MTKSELVKFNEGLDIIGLINTLKDCGIDVFQIREDAIKNMTDKSKEVEILILGGKSVIKYSFEYEKRNNYD